MRRRVRLLAASLLGAVCLAAGGYALAQRTEPEQVWHSYTAEHVGLRFAHPPQWRVEQTGDRGFTARSGDGELRLHMLPHRPDETLHEWASQRMDLAAWEVSERQVAGADVLVLSQPGQARAYLADSAHLHVVRWRGDADEFDRWLDSVELVDPAPTPSPEPAPSPSSLPGPATPSPEPSPPSLRALAAHEFVALFYEAELADVAPVTEPPPITGSRAADKRIVDIAEQRGYRLQQVATSELDSVDGQPLQSAAAQAWDRLADAAAQDGLTLEVISGFRSVSEQRDIFLARLAAEAVDQLGRPYTPAEIADGMADEAIDRVLHTSSIPGYSKHHTGYAVDVRDVGSGLSFTRFGETAGYEWISADNFANATRFGFIPSYPHGVEQQGPVPEEWEFVWVGEEALQNMAAGGASG